MNSFQLKVVACIAMTIDHATILFSDFTTPMHWIGRLAIPIFFFLCAQSCDHTHDLSNYIRRLYIAMTVMTLFEIGLNRVGNIFTTLFHITVLIWILKRPTAKLRILCGAGYLAWQTAAYIVAELLSQYTEWWFELLASTMIGAFTSVDGGMWYVTLGVLFWLCGTANPKRLIIAFSTYCICTFIAFNCTASFAMQDSFIHSALSYLLSGRGAIFSMFARWSPLYGNVQWMMIFVLPLLLMYNGKRGRPVKYFFYAYYPLHITIITVLATMMGTWEMLIPLA